MQLKTVVSSKGQIVIPKYLRDMMGLHAGSEMVISMKDGNILEFKVVQKNIRDFFGKGAQQRQKDSFDVDDVDGLIAQAILDDHS